MPPLHPFGIAPEMPTLWDRIGDIADRVHAWLGDRQWYRRWRGGHWELWYDHNTYSVLKPGLYWHQFGDCFNDRYPLRYIDLPHHVVRPRPWQCEDWS